MLHLIPKRPAQASPLFTTPLRATLRDDLIGDPVQRILFLRSRSLAAISPAEFAGLRVPIHPSLWEVMKRAFRRLELVPLAGAKR